MVTAILILAFLMCLYLGVMKYQYEHGPKKEMPENPHYR